MPIFLVSLKRHSESWPVAENSERRVRAESRVDYLPWIPAEPTITRPVDGEVHTPVR